LSLLKKKNTYCSDYKKKKHCSSSTTVIGFSSSGAPAICDVSASHNGAPAISGASASHSGRPTTEKTCTSVHQSTPICYLRHRPATTTRLTPQETSVDLRLQQHKTTSNSHPQTHHSQHRLVVHRNKGNTTDLHLPPSTVPSPSAATTGRPRQQQ